MTTNRIMRDGAIRRALLLAAVGAALAVLFAACGSGGATTTAVPDKSSDAEVLNRILARQLAAVEAYDRSLPALRGGLRAGAEEFRAQEQAHVDTIVQGLRAIGGKADPPPEAIDASGLKGQADYLRFLYEVESATIDAELKAITQLSAPWLRAQLAAIVANQAQHLVLLRRALGAAPLETVPAPFEDGTTPAP